MSEEYKNILEYVSEITELNEIHEFMKDPKIDEALGYVVKLTVKNDVPAGSVAPLIVKLQALAGVLAVKAKYYTVFEKGGESAKRKNVYFTVEKALNDLVNALKYMAKA